MNAPTMRRGNIRPLAAGLLVAASMPPWGWWPLSFVGVAMHLAPLVGGEPRRRSAFRAGTLFGLGWFLPAMAWMWFLTAPGYLVASLLFACGHGAAATVGTRVGAAGSPARASGLIAAHTLVEAARLYVPFGGVPLATLAVAQVDSPLARLAPVGGVLLITAAVLGLAAAPVRGRAALATIVLIAASGVFDGSRATGDVVRVALIQGGGPQGTRAVDTDFREVFDRHLEQSRRVTTDDGIDIVVWPENVINVDDFGDSAERDEIVAEADRLGVPFSVGVTEDAGASRFTNAQVVVEPGGATASRYDKELRVPFGEYMPMRSLLASLGAPVNLVPSDAVAGRGSAAVEVADTIAAVAISWEVFFARRVDEGVGGGGQWVLNPTNGASYTWTILQTQQVASSRLRAREQGRWVAQVAPTGFTAVVDERGRVLSRTSVGESEAIVTDVELREGTTFYAATGDAPVIAVIGAGLGALFLRRRRAPARPGPKSQGRS